MKTQTHKQTKKQSHIALKNIEGVICSEWLIEHLNISELEINTLKYELGIQFLNLLYPENDSRFLPQFKKISCCESFWKWWRREWDFEAEELVKFISEHKVPFTIEIFINEMLQLVHQSRTEVSFYQYLKIFHNGRM